VAPVGCFFLSAISLLAQGSSSGNLQLSPQTIKIPGRAPFQLRLPQNFQISVAAQGLPRVRFFAQAPDGRIFVTAMHDLSDNRKGAVYILDGFDEKRLVFTKVTPYLTNLRNPNSIAFFTDKAGQEWFYLALTDRLVRYKFIRGENLPHSKPEELATYPAYGLSYKYGGWHLTRTIAFGPDGRLYVSVGSSCNACVEKEEIRATLSVMDADGKNQRILARGLRNAVGMEFVGETLYLTNMGADHLGDELPDDPMFALTPEQLHSEEPLDFGWPHCYYAGGEAKADPGYPLEKGRADCGAAPRAFAYFAAHSSPLGLEYIVQGMSPSGAADSGRDPIPAQLQGGFLVALHGASKKSVEHGYRVVSVDKTGHVVDVVTGFLDGGVLHGRPCDIFRVSMGSFLVSDDHANGIYYVRVKTQN
jgi:glucose/arabinose dehydrogenase